MKFEARTDYETYREVMYELARPIDATGLDCDILKRLYQSKVVYLENLRLQCFREINRKEGDALYSTRDYTLILDALQATRQQLRELVLLTLANSLGKI